MVRPLTKTKKDGALYTRPVAVEAAIRVAIQQDVECLRQRALLSDECNVDFMPLECLVYIVRDAWRRGDRAAMSILMQPLLTRCEDMLRAKLPSRAQEDIENILSDFSFLFIEDGANADELDFFEIRFNRAFRFFRINYLRREQSRSRHFQSLQHRDTAEATDEPLSGSLLEAYGTPPTQVTDVFRKQRLAAISMLPPDEYKAVFLCGVLGFKEESEDPNTITAATLCGVTGRTIRNRLSRAAAKLSQYKEDIRP